MLPRATAERSEREAAKGKIGGRTHEIQRLVGRSLRGVVDLSRLGERTVTVDCDVIVADGGTRTASITGGYVALAAALITYGMDRHLVGHVAAVSVGIIDGVKYLDLDYSRGLARRGRLQRRRDGRRRVRRAPGHGRGQAVRPRRRWTSCSTSPTRASAGCSRRRRRRSRRSAADGRAAACGRAAPAPRRDPLRHKLRELRELLEVGPDVELVSPDDVGIPGEPEETGETFETNARLKARFYARALGPAHARGRLRAGGRRARRRPRRPHAALRRPRRHRRGEQRASCCAELAGCRAERRGARYVCVLALALPGRCRPARRASARSSDAGRAAAASRRRPRGDGGFGYDPIFEPESEPPGGRTLGQWSADAKNAISHRSRAARRMAPVLRSMGF